MDMNTSPQKPDLALPPIIFGSSALGNLYQSLDDSVKLEIVASWFRHSPGIVAADSAGKYGAGLALEVMSKCLVELGIDPAEILISNKLGWRRVPLTTPEPTFEPGAWVDLKYDAVQDISYDGILRCWEQGCELLAPYKPQLVSVHDPDEYLAAATDDSDRERRWDDVLAAYQALGELRDRGEVRAIGVGSKDWKVSQRLVQQCNLDWVMLATSLTIYSHPSDLLDFIETLRQKNIQVINSAVFRAGFLVGGEFFDYRRVDATKDQELFKWRDRFHEICRTYQVTPAEACVAFGMSPAGVVATALNSSRPSQAEKNVRLVTMSLPNEFWNALKVSGLIANNYPVGSVTG